MKGTQMFGVELVKKKGRLLLGKKLQKKKGSETNVRLLRREIDCDNREITVGHYQSSQRDGMG